jgi:RNA polymerase-binding transcription factor DksA
MVEASHAAQRARLVSERDRLRQQLDRLGDGGMAFDENFADSSQVTAERSELEALAGTLGDTLLEIEEALGKLDAGTYGACESCGGPIAEARLDAMPAAKLCINCASQRH